MWNPAEWNKSLPIGLKNSARFTGTSMTSSLKNVRQGGGACWAGWQEAQRGPHVNMFTLSYAVLLFLRKNYSEEIQLQIQAVGVWKCFMDIFLCFVFVFLSRLQNNSKIYINTWAGWIQPILFWITLHKVPKVKNLFSFLFFTEESQLLSHLCRAKEDISGISICRKNVLEK